MRTFATDRRPAHPQITVIDVFHRGIRIDTFAAGTLSDVQLKGITHLRAPSTAPQLPQGTRTAFREAATNEYSFEAALARLRSLDLSASCVILGSNSDPFVPFQGKFDWTLKIIERIAAARPARFILQTTSPLVLLAAPLLVALRERACVTIAFGALSDSLAHSITPGTPRPSERLQACRALQAAGVLVAAQLAPIAQEDELLEYAHTIRQVADRVMISDAYANETLCRDLRRIFACQAPQLLAEHVLAAASGYDGFDAEFATEAA